MTDTTTPVEWGEPVASAVEATPVEKTEEPTTPEWTTTPTDAETFDLGLTQEELDEIAKQFAQPVTEPTFFPWDKKDEPDNNMLADVFKQMDTLIESEVKKDAIIKEKDESLAKVASDIENLKAELNDKSQYVETFQEFYTNLNGILDTETIDKIGEWDLSSVPKHIIPENWKRVQENTFLYPYVEKLLAWENVDIPKMIIDLVNSKKATLPKPVAPAVLKEEAARPSAMDMLVGGLKARNKWL